jgi:hypothetical protein
MASQKTVWYVRIGKETRIRIHSAFGTPEFDAEYRAAIDGLPARQTSKPDNTITGSMAWLIERYRETGQASPLTARSSPQPPFGGIWSYYG